MPAKRQAHDLSTVCMHGLCSKTISLRITSARFRRGIHRNLVGLFQTQGRSSYKMGRRIEGAKPTFSTLTLCHAAIPHRFQPLWRVVVMLASQQPGLWWSRCSRVFGRYLRTFISLSALLLDEEKILPRNCVWQYTRFMCPNSTAVCTSPQPTDREAGPTCAYYPVLRTSSPSASGGS
jgi:hypothetical protein